MLELTAVHTRTPKQITKHIKRLIAKVAPGQQAVHLSVRPVAGASVNECFPNVEARIAASDGRMLCGWQIWEWPHILVEAEFHAVWLSPDGEMVEVTPKQNAEDVILFVPDHSLSYAGAAKDNVRIAVRDDLLVHHFIRTAQAIFEVLNRGERSGAYGYISVPANEIEPLMNAQAFLGQSISAGLRDHSPCQCGSGGKYRQCHGKGFPW